jgi:hypothetical protein
MVVVGVDEEGKREAPICSAKKVLCNCPPAKALV